MIKSRIKHRYCKLRKSRICQGDIFRDLSFIFLDEENKSARSEMFVHFGVILSQECDLKSDFLAREKNKKAIYPYHDKYLPTILLCPAYPIDDFLNGVHIGNWNMQGSKDNKIDKNKLIDNSILKRYHYLKNSDNPLIPELVIDFKHFLTIPTETIYKTRKERYLASMSELFREELSQRFASYLSRIGLPEL